jgi:CheY-like chemotaxis protein
MNDNCEAFVMVVDDDTDLREAITEMLQDSAYSVVGAANGKEALDFLRGTTSLPCIILLDLMMPIMDGKTFRAELLKDPKLSEIPVVVLSAHANMDSVLAGVTVSAKLRKPVQMGSLMALVDRHCKNAAAPAEA